MDVRHEQFRFSDEFTVLLAFDGTHGNGSTLVYIKTIGLSCIHFGMGCAVAMQRALADLCVDASRDEEGDANVVVFQFQGFVETE